MGSAEPGGCLGVYLAWQVDYEDPRVKVVVHIYEPYIKSCHALNRYLEELARRHPSVKFLRMQVSPPQAGARAPGDTVGLLTPKVVHLPSCPCDHGLTVECNPAGFG